jgi:hypothetical protein
MRFLSLAVSMSADLYHCFVEPPRAAASLTQAGTRGTNEPMSMLDAVKDVVVGRAVRLMSDPRISRVMGDERVMNVAMKAVGLGGSIKAELDRASRFAAGLFGLATQEEVSVLRSTIQTLEDNLAIMESKGAAGGPSTQGAGR